MTTNNRNNNKTFGDPSLVKTVHWRRVKNTAYAILDMANVDKNNYNFDNICCYTCTGTDLQGNNVTYTAGKNMSCWVSDNSYTVFEIPATSNTGEPYEGWFFILAQNTSFDYWMAGAMNYKINVGQSKRYNRVIDKVSFSPFGQFTVSPEINGATSSMVVECKISGGSKCVFDTRVPSIKNFDNQGGRKRAYKTSENEILAKLKGSNYSMNHTVGGSDVKKYKNNFSNRGKSRSGTRK